MKKEVIEKFKVKTFFNLAQPANIQNVAMAICQAGFPVRIRQNGTGYEVIVYEHV